MSISPASVTNPPVSSTEDLDYQLDNTGCCPHLKNVLGDENKRTEILTKYRAVIAWNVNRTQQVLHPHPAKRRKISSPTCGQCDTTLSRPFTCLHCSFAGCWVKGHIVEHQRVKGHRFCVDAKSGSIYCLECDGFIYDSVMEGICLSSTLSAEERHTKFQVKKQRREPFHPWVPNPKELAALEGTVAIPCQGRRGLLNLGQTCFLNVVLQSFIHNPLLRNYFLSDKHNEKLCKSTDCTCCEMDRLFAEIYSNSSVPHGPTSFLHTTWRASTDLSGYAQQDAHEFFILALNQIHTTSRGSTNVSCNCIVHNVFAGQLQSDVKCEKCGNITSTVDPMLDISLELKDKGKGDGGSGENTLASCLRRYTKPEKLGPKEYSCSKCSKGSQSSEASKRLSIRKLPPVLSFQFKRFEHKTTDKTSAQKIDAPIRFPASLNMAPYTTLVMNGSNGKAPSSSYPGPEAIYEYELFAVINHEGQIDNGHYTNYARFQDEWYRFDDDKVTHSNLGACLNSPAYMCFYVKRHLDYKPYAIPSYVLTRETEAAREKEIEQEKERARNKELEDALLATV